jgi:hypothetical protein
MDVCKPLVDGGAPKTEEAVSDIMKRVQNIRMAMAGESDSDDEDW